MSDLTIGKAADRAGVRVATIRFYERRALIKQPSRPRNGFRVYPEETVRRIRFIRQAQELGFSLKEIKELLSLQTDPGTDCGDIRDRAIAKFGDVNLKIEKLMRIRNTLEQLISSCPGRGDLDTCSILNALSDADGL